jgi:hypothetical protein
MSMSFCFFTIVIGVIRLRSGLGEQYEIGVPPCWIMGEDFISNYNCRIESYTGDVQYMAERVDDMLSKAKMTRDCSRRRSRCEVVMAMAFAESCCVHMNATSEVGTCSHVQDAGVLGVAL